MESQSQFPVDVLPDRVQSIISALHEAYSYPIEYTASAMLAAFGAAMGNRFSIEVKDGWRERGLLYCVIVGSAGANKTHPLSFAMRPLVNADIEAISLAQEGETPKRTVVSDTTQEGLVRLHSKNLDGMILYLDELKAWVSNFSRYSGGSQEQFWLSVFSQSPVIVDRKSDPQPTTIQQPFIAVLGSAQPSILEAFTQGDKATNGFVDRMLFVVKKDAEKPYWSDKELDPSCEESWRSLIKSASTHPKVTARFTAKAREEAAKWQAKNTDLINEEQNPHFVGPYSKLEIYFVRFCLILHQLRYFCGEVADPYQVDDTSVLCAARLIEYYREQIHEVEPWLYPDPEEQLKGNAKKLFRALPDSKPFSTQQAFDLAKRIGIPRSSAYRAINNLRELYLGINEEGDLYKL